MNRTAALWVLACAACTASGPSNESTSPEADASLPSRFQSAAVQAYSEGLISRGSAIRIRFASDIVEEPADVGRVVDPSPFQIEPEVEGATVIASSDEIQFRPDAELVPDVRYRVTFDPSVLFGTDGAPFSFSVSVRPATFEVHWIGLEASTPDRQAYRGVVHTSESADSQDVEAMVTATQDGELRTVDWDHRPDGRRHRFIVTDLLRGSQETQLAISVDGRPLGIEDSERRTVPISARSVFSVLSVTAETATEPALLRFSEPIDQDQNLRGLIRSEPARNLRFETQDNVVQVFATPSWPENISLQIRAGVRSAEGDRIQRSSSFQLSFVRPQPGVRFPGKGVILPVTDDLVVPIETANLRHARVTAYRIPSENMGQFLQVNRLEDDQELQRVGRVVWRQRVDLLATSEQQDRWVRRGLDLRPLLQEDPRGLYRIEVRFEPSDIDFTCPSGSFEGYEPQPPVDENAFSGEESSYWDSSENGYFDLYRARKDPCSPAYYRSWNDHDITVSKNVLLSRVGLMVKRGSNEDLFVATSDLLTAQPLTSARITVLNFQLQSIAEGTTDDQGLAWLHVPEPPFVVFAHDGAQLGVVRLHDGEALSVAHFDTGGVPVEKGLQGYFYGERGVWRPGDDIFLTFVLNRHQSSIPADHPVHFRLRDSRGRVVDRQTSPGTQHGFHVFRTQTTPEARTGDYIAEVRVGDVIFEKALSIEAVMPNRLDIDLDFESELLMGPTVQFRSGLVSRWLHGAPASNLKTEVEAKIQSTETRFPKREGFVFEDPTRSIRGEPKLIFSGRLGEDGSAQVDTTLQCPDTGPGMVEVQLTTRVYESSGPSSIDRDSIRCSPFPRYVGVKKPKGDRARGMLLTDVEHEVQLAAVDPRGEPVDTRVRVQLFKIEWRWWWERGREALADYAGTQSHRALLDEEVDIRGGTATWRFQRNHPEWGRYLLMVSDLQGRHRSGTILYMDWPGWAGRGQRQRPGGAQVLSLAADASSYEVGETVHLTFPGARGARALVALESGDRLLDARWVDASEESVQHTFVTAPDMAPGVYAHVTVIQPYEGRANDAPLRLYGVVPLDVVDPTQALKPSIETEDIYRPRSTHRIAVRESQGRPMTYTLAVVDEGLLGLTGFSTPNPAEHFHARPALGVKTWDVFSSVQGAQAGKLETRLAIGGDGTSDSGGTRRANRFPPVVWFDGPFRLDAGERRVHEVQIPSYLGAVRIMVVGGDEGAFGSTEKRVPVTTPLMLFGSLPRVLGPGEKLDLPVTIFASERVDQVELEATADGPVELGLQKSVTRLASAGNQTIRLPLEVQDTVGVAKIRVTAKSARHSTYENIEVAVRHPNPPSTNFIAASVASGEAWSSTIDLLGVPGTRSLELEVSHTLPLNLSRRLEQLIRYPHGCVEQTTSAAFPQVYLNALLDLEPASRRRVTAHVEQAIEKIRGAQTPRGGFSYWPGEEQAHDWTSSWVGHFLLEAQRAGFHVSEHVLDAWKRHQRQVAARWGWSVDQPNSTLDQAYRLYTLALAGAPELSAMNHLREMDPERLTPAAQARLSAAYALAGQREVARSLLPRPHAEPTAYAQVDQTFGSRLRDAAMMLEAFVGLDGGHPDLPRWREAVSASLDEAEAHDTHGIAFGLVALARATLAQGRAVALDVDGEWGADRFRLQSTKPVARTDLSSVDARRILTLHNNGKQPLFVRIALRGTPPPGREQAKEEGISVNVDYAIEPQQPEARDIGFVQGTTFWARVTVRPKEEGSTIQRVAVTQIFPSGWEIRQERGHGMPSVDYQDIRDDRVLTYIDELKGPVTFRVRLHAAFAGTFYLPPVRAEAMYDAEVQAQTAGQWIRVVRPEDAG